jgi:hypothetical protein
MNTSHERDIEISSELMRLGTLLESLDKKLDFITDDIKLYMQAKSVNHAEMETR